MNKVTTSVLATIIALAVLFFLGRLMFLSGIQREILQTSNRLAQLEENKALLEVQLEKIKGSVKQETKPTRKSNLLVAGQEYTLLSSLLACAGNMKIQNFELMSSYHVKTGEDENVSSSSGGGFNATEELPQLDDQGMPVGSSVEEDTEWPGIEIIPLKLSFTTTYRNLGMFMSEIDRNLPINVVRSMDVLIKDSGIAKGTIVMLFPVAE